MLIKLPDEMQSALETKVRLTMSETVVIDIAKTAEEIRKAFVDRNVAHEDIAESVARFAVRCGYPVHFADRARAN